VDGPLVDEPGATGTCEDVEVDGDGADDDAGFDADGEPDVPDGASDVPATGDAMPAFLGAAPFAPDPDPDPDAPPDAHPEAAINTATTAPPAIPKRFPRFRRIPIMLLTGHHSRCSPEVNAK
jgi:hypothetical protein